MKPPVCTKPREVPEQGDAGQDLTLQAPFEARRCDFGASRRQGCPSPPSLALPSCADSPWAVPWRAELQKKSSVCASAGCLGSTLRAGWKPRWPQGCDGQP